MSLCCIAHEYGLLHGINSGIEKQKCPKHDALFIDNEFTKPYNHEKHVDVIKRHRPKYATVRDIMPPEMCGRLGVQYYPPEQVIDWAWELKEYANEVIIIPKTLEYLGQVPEEFMIGYPMPSGYIQGEELLPPEAYNGKRLHLLGGSWARQLSYLYFFGDDVVSMDGNYIAKIGMLRQFVDPAGQVHSLNEVVKFQLNNALHIAFSISCSSIQTALNALLMS